MLSDRPYMRETYQRERTSALTWLISAMIAGFVLQLLTGLPWVRGGNRLGDVLGLTVSGVQGGWLWAFLTHAFLHSTSFIPHGIITVVGLYFLGRELLPMLGPRRFLGLFAAATMVSGAAWTAVHWQGESGMLIGSTAAVEAMFIVFACFFPNQQTSFLLLFIPVTIKPKQVAYALVAIGLIGFFCYELPGNTLPFDLPVASSAHLAGMLTGYLYYRFVHDGRWFTSQDGVEIELPRWINRVKKPEAIAAGATIAAPPPPSRAELRAEVDRILDKINSEGLGALTLDEKRLLGGAKDLLRHG